MRPLADDRSRRIVPIRDRRANGCKRCEATSPMESLDCGWEYESADALEPTLSNMARSQVAQT